MHIDSYKIATFDRMKIKNSGLVCCATCKYSPSNTGVPCGRNQFRECLGTFDSNIFLGFEYNHWVKDIPPLLVLPDNLFEVDF